MAMIQGIKKIVYSKRVDGTGENGVAPIYQTPVRIYGANTAEVTRKNAKDTYYGDDQPQETAYGRDVTTIGLTVKSLSPEIYADLLGHTMVGGEIQANYNDEPPHVAIGIEFAKSSGGKKMEWFVNGQFELPSETVETKGESVKLQPLKITGDFSGETYDGAAERILDSDAVDYTAAKAAVFFDNPIADADTTAPTVTCVPADGATAVAVDADIVLTFSEAIAVSTLVVGSSLVIAKDDGTVVAGTGAWNTAHTVYTFTPTSNLSGNYNVNVTTAVKDLSGNALAAVNIFNFATV